MNNTYAVLQEVRSKVGEVDTDQGEHWGDIELQRKIQAAYRRVAMKLMMKPHGWWLTSVDLTPASGSVTLPQRMGRFVRLEKTSNQQKIEVGTAQHQRNFMPHPSGFSSVTPRAWLQGQKIYFTDTSYAAGVTLWYEKTPAAPITGVADTGSGSNTLVLPAAREPFRVDDYYNGVSFEIVGGTGTGTLSEVSDYVASTRTLTLDGEFADTSEFASVLETPEEALEVIVLIAAQAAISKPGSTLEKEYFQYLRAEIKDAWDVFEDWAATRIKDNIFLRS